MPVLASEELPDLIIEDMVIYPAHNPREESFNCKVKNIGDASTPPNKFIYVSVTLRWKILNIIPLIPIRVFTGGTLNSLVSGESNAITFAGTSSHMPFFGYYTFYCTVNPQYIIEESNYQNNDYTETVFFLGGHSFP